MKSSHRNVFWVFGLAVLCWQGYGLWNDEAWTTVARSVATVLLPLLTLAWALDDLCSARSYQLVVNHSSSDLRLPFRKAYKLTLTGSAFGAVTPFGLGGGPYRVMELSRYIGVPRAMSAVVVDCLLQLFSLFLLWLVALGGFAIGYADRMSRPLTLLFISLAIGLTFALAFLFHGFRKGLLDRLYRGVLLHQPFGRRFFEKCYHRCGDVMIEVDQCIARLYAAPRVFWKVMGYQFLSRLGEILEILLLLWILGVDLSFAEALLILAFSSLLGYLFPLLPASLAVSCGGFACAATFLEITSWSIATLAVFYMRLREWCWIALGIGLLKIGNARMMR